MMPELIAGIIAYNEEKLLPQCLESIKGKVDRIVLVEGRIAEFPGDSVRSADRTIEIANDYGCEVITQQAPYANEPAMRNQYLKGKQGDWYILIDADERCMTDLPDIADFPAGIRAFSINIRMIGAPISVFRPRLFKHSGTMEYRAIHDGLFSDNRLVSRPRDVLRLHSIWFAHYQMKRSKNRRAEKMAYYKTGYAHEADYRHEWEMFNNG